MTRAWPRSWRPARAPKLHLALADSQHPAFSDFEELVPEVAPVLGLTPSQVAALVGTIDPKTAVTDERVYIRAFFDKYLRNRLARPGISSCFRVTVPY